MLKERMQCGVRGSLRIANSRTKQPVPWPRYPALASSGPSAPLLISDSRRKMGHRQQIVVWTNLFLAVNQPDSTLNLDD